MTDIFDGIQLRKDGVAPSQWPKLSCSDANQLSLEFANLKLDSDREINFQGNGQLKISGDLRFLTGNPATEKIVILANGNVGIGESNPQAKLSVNGNLKLQIGVAINEFSNDSNLTDNSDLSIPTEQAVKTYVDNKKNEVVTQMNSVLAEKANLNGSAAQDFQTNNLTVNGNLNASSFLGNGATLDGIVKKAGDTMTGSLTVQNNLTVTGNVGIGTTSPGTKLEVKGHLTLDAADSPTLYTGTGNSELNRYLQLINSSNSRSASGLKAGGILVSDSYAYANPGKNNLIVKGNVGIGTSNPDRKLVVRGGETSLEQEGWQTPTFQNGWVNYSTDYNAAGYFKDSLGVIHLRGLVKNGSGTIFTLPEGYRPPRRELFGVATNPNVMGRIDVLSDGQVYMVTGNNGWISLDGITFKAGSRRLFPLDRLPIDISDS